MEAANNPGLNDFWTLAATAAFVFVFYLSIRYLQKKR